MTYPLLMKRVEFFNGMTMVDNESGYQEVQGTTSEVSMHSVQNRCSAVTCPPKIVQGDELVSFLKPTKSIQKDNNTQITIAGGGVAKSG